MVFGVGITLFETGHPADRRDGSASQKAWYLRRGGICRMLVLVMGVAGSGKTLIGAMLAESLGYLFADADEFHPRANIEKMSRGIPLTDADREPWLRAIQERLCEWSAADISAVVTCSALKQKYRDMLGQDCDVTIVYLKGDFDLIHGRLQQRQGHFMRPEMLRSQFADLEEPASAIVVDVSGPPEKIVEEIRRKLVQSATVRENP
jgi:gluconokinase